MSQNQPVRVLVVPEAEGFQRDVSHDDLVWINAALGVPQLKDQHADYLAPCWLSAPAGVRRVYHIVPHKNKGERNSKDSRLRINSNNTELCLGNSFVLDTPWNKMKQPRRFEYHELSEFGFRELTPGILCPSSSSLCLDTPATATDPTG